MEEPLLRIEGLSAQFNTIDGAVRAVNDVSLLLKREQEATLKRYYHEGSQVRLQPANETMQPIRTDADNVEVQGKVIGAVRALR